MRFLLYRIFIALARWHARTSRWGWAAAAYRRAIAIEPTPPAWLQLGHAYKENGQFDAALNAYSSSLELDPNNSDCWTHYAHLNRFLGRSPLSGRPGQELAPLNDGVGNTLLLEPVLDYFSAGAGPPTALACFGTVVDPRSYANATVVRSRLHDSVALVVRHYLQHIPFYNIEHSRLAARQDGIADMQGELMGAERSDAVLNYGEIILVRPEASRDLRNIGEGISIINGRVMSSGGLPLPAGFSVSLQRPGKAAEANLRLLIGSTSEENSHTVVTIGEDEGGSRTQAQFVVKLSPMSVRWIKIPVKFDQSVSAVNQTFVISLTKRPGQLGAERSLYAICATDSDPDDLWRAIVEKIDWYDYPTIREIELKYNFLNIKSHISSIEI